MPRIQPAAYRTPDGEDDDLTSVESMSSIKSCKFSVTNVGSKSNWRAADE